VKLRDLVVAHDTRLLIEWDHTSQLHAAVFNLTCVVLSFSGKSKAKPRPAQYFHPYRETKIQGMKITPKNISVLKILAGALARG
jgi:hypothetical protein